MTRMTGLTGNEMFCLDLKGLSAGDLVLGNSVYSMGFMGAIGASLQGIVGGEVSQVTDVISEGRHLSQHRLLKEAQAHGANGITSVTSELRSMQGNVEFLSVASCVHAADPAATRNANNPAAHHGFFSTSGNGQELYCMLDAGYQPLSMVLGNVAYSMGVGGGIMGTLRSLGRGEVKEFSDVFNTTRHRALDRIVREAREVGADAVVGIKTHIMPFQGVHEMLMLGTSARHPKLKAAAGGDIITSNLTCEEMWNLAALGYVPQKLLLGTSVYSLGLLGGVTAMFKSLARGEVNELTGVLYDARERAMGLIKAEAEAIGADQVVGVKTYIHEIGSLVEFLAVGTAVKKHADAKPLSPMLPAQAVITEKSTWISRSDGAFATVQH
jgi:uncharacterized protein YbjQ (UPF0145 family)